MNDVQPEIAAVDRGYKGVLGDAMHAVLLGADNPRMILRNLRFFMP